MTESNVTKHHVAYFAIKTSTNLTFFLSIIIMLMKRLAKN